MMNAPFHHNRSFDENDSKVFLTSVLALGILGVGRNYIYCTRDGTLPGITSIHLTALGPSIKECIVFIKVTLGLVRHRLQMLSAG